MFLSTYYVLRVLVIFLLEANSALLCTFLNHKSIIKLGIYVKVDMLVYKLKFIFLICCSSISSVIASNVYIDLTSLIVFLNPYAIDINM